MKAFAALLALISAVVPPVAAQAASSDFAHWAAVVVAGDFHAHDGGPTEGFDNARRDVTQALVKAGFDPANIQQFSVRPERYPDAKALPATPGYIKGALQDLASRAKDGCLLYFSSHGAPDGIVLGNALFGPAGLSRMVDEVCGARPTVVILSACFSGVFIPALADANRVILTAARPDRTSFGCGQDIKYPYFDDCILSSFPQVSDFAALATAARVCVSQREMREGAKPPSEPQLFIGAGIRPDLPFYSFAKR